MKFEIAALNVREAPALAAMWHSAWHETQGPHVPGALIALRTYDDFLARIAADLKSFRISGSPTQPLGFCRVTGNHLDQLFCAPAARGTGIAAALLAEGEARLAASGVVDAQLECLVENSAARRFYARHDWVERGIGPAILATASGTFTLDCMIFEKQLLGS